MGLPNKKLYATNVGSERIFLSAWIPCRKEGDDGEIQYFWPPNTAIGSDMWVPNVLHIKPEDGTVPVKIVASETETGIWLICYDDYFGDEQHIFNWKPRFIEGTIKFDYHYPHTLDLGDDIFGIHVVTDIKMKAGDSPIPVTLVIDK